MRGSKPAGFSGVRVCEWVSEQRAHSIGLAAAAVLVAPLVRVLSSAISSTMCAASEKTAAVTMPARWWERYE